jgi:hypothetical protein
MSAAGRRPFSMSLATLFSEKSNNVLLFRSSWQLRWVTAVGRHEGETFEAGQGRGDKRVPSHWKD